MFMRRVRTIGISSRRSLSRPMSRRPSQKHGGRNLMLQRVKLTLSCALFMALIGLVVQAILLLRTATESTRELPGALSAELAATRVALTEQIEGTRKDLTGQVAAARTDLLVRTERQVEALREASQTEVRHA